MISPRTISTRKVSRKEKRKVWKAPGEMIVEMLKDDTLIVQKIASLAKAPVEYVTQIAQEITE